MKVSGAPDKAMAPEGTHILRCFQIIDKGTKEGDNGNYRAFAVGFELTEEEADEQGNPVTTFPMLAAQIGKDGGIIITPRSKMGKAVSALTGKQIDKDSEVDLGVLIDKYCLGTIVHQTKDNKTYANVEALMPLTKGTKGSRGSMETKVLFLEKGEFDKNVLESLPDFIREEIEKSPEYRKLFAGQKKAAGKAPVAPSKGKPTTAKGKGRQNDETPF